MIRMLAAASVLATATVAFADESAVRRLLEGKLGAGGAIESVRKLPDSALFEAAIRSREGVRIVYVDEAASLIIAGSVFDARTGRNLTEERLRSLTAIRWESLPFGWALSTTRGSGRRKIAVFSDPNCPYCKRFEKDLAKLDDTTVHIFMYPVIKPESAALAKAVWCSKDRVRSWNNLMLKDIHPRPAPDCEAPIEQLVALGRKLGVNSTPTWFLESGERHQGALPLEEVRALLDAALRARP